MTKLTYATALLGALSAVSALPDQSKRDILAPLPQNADAIELKFQPFLDFDSDGCYQTAAVDINGNLNPGKKFTGTPQGQCRDQVQLDNSNTYSRRRCNNGVCGIIYEYYYEKDQQGLGPGSTGHRHDWENVVVFTRGDQVLRVAPSCHGEYKHATSSGFPLDGTHPLIVYHKDGPNTHCHRLAKPGEKAENPTGSFFRAPLVGWLGWPNEGLRDKVNNRDWKRADAKTRESKFAQTLKDAGAESVGLNWNGPDDYLL